MINFNQNPQIQIFESFSIFELRRKRKSHSVIMQVFHDTSNAQIPKSLAAADHKLGRNN